MAWLTPLLAILAMSPLSCTINKVLQLILETITYCFSIVIKVTHGKKAGNRENDTNEGMYLDRQKQFLLTLLSMVEKKYNAVNFRTLLNDPMAKLPEYEPPKLHEIMG